MTLATVSPPHPAKSVLVARRITQKRVAAMVGYDEGHTSRVLNRQLPATPRFRQTLAALLNLPESELFFDEAER